jgi:hypothetical protein
MIPMECFFLLELFSNGGPINFKAIAACTVDHYIGEMVSARYNFGTPRGYQDPTFTDLQPLSPCTSQAQVLQISQSIWGQMLWLNRTFECLMK